MPAIWLPFGTGPSDDDFKSTARGIGETRGSSGYDSFYPEDLYTWMDDHAIRSVPAKVEKIDGKWIAVKIRPVRLVSSASAPAKAFAPQQTQGIAADNDSRPYRKTAP